MELITEPIHCATAPCIKFPLCFHRYSAQFQFVRSSHSVCACFEQSESLHSWILVHVCCGHALLFSFSMQFMCPAHITVGLWSFQFAIYSFSRCRRIVNINRVSYVFSVQSQILQLPVSSTSPHEVCVGLVCMSSVSSS